ncbi:diguanylate cyclase [Teredinibacter purpureus]|jgi:response regulator receiver modulated diguanylate cyclase|uniref:diguanylate cyclase n=1 Tax=Teredinibacter purpureus TaxID=2731756 RepID=UPI0005F865D7|nr:diguanylate cyclase [Teredinibacter purpureus]
MTKVLVVDDVEDNIVLLTFELEDEGFEVVSASSGRECLELVPKTEPDIILLDIRMPGISGLETLEQLKANELTREIPVIMVSANTSDNSIVRALDLGAHDFVPKPIEYPVLSARMRSALRLVNARRALVKANEELERLATQDPLTDSYNRRHFFTLSEAEFSKSLRYGRPLSVLMIDVDLFKAINDTYGHAAGDHALRVLTDCCREATRESDILGRLGGEEFALTCPDADLEGAFALAERIRQNCEQQKISTEAGEAFSITLSIGVTTIAETDTRFDNTLQRADNLLYQAKALGRNRSVAC